MSSFPRPMDGMFEAFEQFQLMYNRLFVICMLKKNILRTALFILSTAINARSFEEEYQNWLKNYDMVETDESV